MSEWNNAGKLFRIEGGGPWFDSNIRFKMALKQHPQLMEQPQVKDILKDFVKPWGDRRQEVVIIGVGIEEEKVSALLDACLLTEEEMKAGAKAWKQYPDPLPQWQKLPFEYEEEKEEEEDKREGRIVVILFLDRWGLKMFDDSFEVLTLDKTRRISLLSASAATLIISKS
mmetsp:Transcript_3858/g.6101  ORF Transcript_3858/g.6101 Transcript_3858/m.6101 type:complete len:170 (-) Transcript_3858:1364-1873(-)